jgi:hypothetical protein
MYTALRVIFPPCINGTADHLNPKICLALIFLKARFIAGFFVGGVFYLYCFIMQSLENRQSDQAWSLCLFFEM